MSSQHDPINIQSADTQLLQGKFSAVVLAERIRSCNAKHIVVQKAVVDGSLNIESVMLSKLSIHEAKINGDLIIRNAEFSNGIHLSKLRVLSHIGFMDVHAKKDIVLHYVNVPGVIESDYMSVDDSLYIDQCEFSNLSLRNTKAMVFRYDGRSVSPEEILAHEVTIDHMACGGEIYLSSIDDVSRLFIRNARSPSLKVAKSAIGGKACIVIEDGRFNTVHLGRLAAGQESLVRIQECEIHNLQCDISMSDTSAFCLPETTVSQVADLGLHAQRGADIDISGCHFQRLRMPSELASGSLSFHGSPLFKGGDDERNIETAKIIKRMFNENHDFGDEDRMFYLLKSLEQKRLFASFAENRHIRDLFDGIVRMLYRYGFGWGVRIRNPLVTLVIVIIMFGLIYFSLAFSSTGVTLSVVHERYSGLLASILMSLFAILNLDPPDAKLSRDTTYVYLLEFGIGLFFATLIIGIIIRKLIR